MASYNVITNTANGCGLQRDAEIACERLEALGHTARPVHFLHATGAERADCNLWLEVLQPYELLDLAPCNLLVPNPEWWFAERWNPLLPRIDGVLCKTRDAETIFRGLVGERACYTGWEARDLYDPGVERRRAFIHVAGKSSAKGTAQVLQAAAAAERKGYGWPPVTVVSYRHMRVPGTRWLSVISTEEMRQELNAHRFHLCPSLYEGYGHALHEAQGVGAVVVTTDAPPMSEFGAPLQVRAKPERAMRLGRCWQVSATHAIEGRAEAEVSLLAAMERCWAAGEETLEAWGREARVRFEQDRAGFRKRFTEAVRIP